MPVDLDQCAASLWHAPDAVLSRVAASHGPWLLASCATLATSVLDRNDLALRLALLCRHHTQVYEQLLTVCTTDVTDLLQLGGRTEDALVRALRATDMQLRAAPPAAPGMLRCSVAIPLLLHGSGRVRTLATSVVAHLLRAVDSATDALVAQCWPTSCPALSILQPRSHERMLARASGARVLSAYVASAFSGTGLGDSNSLPAGIVLVGKEFICGLISPAQDDTARLVTTSHAESTLQSLAVCLSSSRPGLLCGPTGSGKSALLTELASRMGQRQEVVRVHMDEQIDSKVLLGTYVTTEEPGEFTWQAGVVTQAVAQGRWLLLEDVDRAPLEVVGPLCVSLTSPSDSLPCPDAR